MLPSLFDLGIEPGSFIRKLDNQNHWNAHQDEDLSRASKLIAEKIFKEAGEKYSLWKVNTEQEFYGVVASLTANANPKDRNIDFIWVTKSELKEVDIEFDSVSEGNCLKVNDLHFDAVINQEKARQLCHNLIVKQRVAQRCKKAQTVLILQYQRDRGCKATNADLVLCDCQKP
ncbi:hypothetical protein C7B82_23785 [Stenomitos frigidus ULC18]|uniref:Uncharacterized protein n=2 Tax=Stenomitos TaxID=1844270 RepID=A0A2T1DXX1_9CYAN|nr:hypothetical protein C7B82_23785 [Stenomitos frigidus ULC18]